MGIHAAEASKACTKCKATKPTALFSRDKYAPDGLCRWCKSCQRAYHDSTRDGVRARNREWHRKNPEKSRVQRDSWQRENKAARAEIFRRWRQANPAILAAHTQKRRALKMQAIPAWASLDAIASIYERAKQMTQDTGEQWSVDHIVPLTSDIVCGLHCEANLQIITQSENSSKKNHYWPDMPEKETQPWA